VNRAWKKQLTPAGRRGASEGLVDSDIFRVLKSQVH
jgi:hypothetical protein